MRQRKVLLSPGPACGHQGGQPVRPGHRGGNLPNIPRGRVRRAVMRVEHHVVGLKHQFHRAVEATGQHIANIASGGSDVLASRRAREIARHPAQRCRRCDRRREEEQPAARTSSTTAHVSDSETSRVTKYRHRSGRPRSDATRPLLRFARGHASRPHCPRGSPTHRAGRTRGKTQGHLLRPSTHLPAAPGCSRARTRSTGNTFAPGRARSPRVAKRSSSGRHTR